MITEDRRIITEGTVLLVKGVERGGTETEAIVVDLGGPDECVGVAFANPTEEDGNGFAWVDGDDIVDLISDWRDDS